MLPPTNANADAIANALVGHRFRAPLLELGALIITSVCVEAARPADHFVRATVVGNRRRCNLRYPLGWVVNNLIEEGGGGGGAAGGHDPLAPYRGLLPVPEAPGNNSRKRARSAASGRAGKKSKGARARGRRSPTPLPDEATLEENVIAQFLRSNSPVGAAVSGGTRVAALARSLRAVDAQREALQRRRAGLARALARAREETERALIAKCLS